jgi:hypothetical protein
MSPERARLWDDFVLFARAEVLSGDVDPMYPLLRRTYTAARLEPETALWRTLLFLTWYNVGSAEKVWRAHPKPAKVDPVRFASLAVGVERRSFKGVGGNVQARAFLGNVMARAGRSLASWVTTFGSGEAGWRSARRELEAVSGGGPWASSKWAELLKHVHGLPITAPDIGALGKAVTSGPIPALVALTGKAGRAAAADVDLQREVFATAITRGVPFSGLDQMRTVLCDFNALMKGSYYVGHDIDLQMSELDGAGPELWEARAAFPDAYRGEKAREPWSGVRRDLCKVYRARGELANVWV